MRGLKSQIDFKFFFILLILSILSIYYLQTSTSAGLSGRAP